MLEKKDPMTSHESISLFIPSDIVAKESSHSFLRNLIITKIGYYDKAYGHQIYRDESNEYIMLYCINGSGWIEVDGKRREVTTGNIIFCDINCPHGYGADNINPWSIYWVHFVGEGVKELFQALGISSQTPLLAVGESYKIISLIEEAYKTLSNGYSFPNLFYSSTCFQEFFCYLIKLNMYSYLQGGNNIDVDSIIEFMKKNINTNFTLQQFAEHINVSKYHFIRKFKHITGYSPIEYFNRLKIQKACELIDTSTCSINEISDILGFNNPNYFSEVFKRITGYSPKEYRILHRV